MACVFRVGGANRVRPGSFFSNLEGANRRGPELLTNRERGRPFSSKMGRQQNFFNRGAHRLGRPCFSNGDGALAFSKWRGGRQRAGR